MPSLLPGFEYDIFISYRQKDNKGDRWVSEFVEALRTELEATFKEDISVYFDINPHDGLLETHDVDASLKDKLKCLVFIPIISRTYCDPNSFAWEHEFKAFVKQASVDQFGLKVRLPNGNIGTRILPIQIHDLNPDDKSLIEKELGGVLRAIEFIYKEPGVNKALTTWDNNDKNTNKTNYRIQINKLANAIDEIIHGLKMAEAASESGKSKHDKPVAGDQKEEKNRDPDKYKRGKTKRWLIMALSVSLCIVGVFTLYNFLSSGKQARNVQKQAESIAVLPFLNDSPDTNNLYFCNGMMEDILNNLVKIKELNVKSRTDVESYRGTKKSRKEIAKELSVSYLLEGSMRKQDNQFRLMVQLIDAETGFHKWSQPYEGEALDIFKVQAEVAKRVSKELEIVLSSKEKNEVEKIPTSNLEAYEYYILAREESIKYWKSHDSRDLTKTFEYLNKAISLDPSFENAIGLKGVCYGSMNQLDSALICAERLLKLNPESFNAYTLLGDYYRYTNEPVPAIENYRKALKVSSNQNKNDLKGIYLWLGGLYCINLNNYREGLPYFKLAEDTSSYVYWMYLASAFAAIGDFNRAEKYMGRSVEIDSSSVSIYGYCSLLTWLGRFDESQKLMDKYCRQGRGELLCVRLNFYNNIYREDYENALKYAKDIFRFKDQITTEDSVYLAYLYKHTGRNKEALEIVSRALTSYKKQSHSDKGPRPIIFSSFLYGISGDKQRSLENLSRAIEMGSIIGNASVFYWFLDIMPFNEEFHNDIKFNEIVNREKEKAAKSRAEVDEMRERGEIDP